MYQQNRFHDRPEIYKQFLEILQTYQRESKPIQDVYSQVTTLFNSAPDLLEDFKQFLPESAAHAKAAAAARAAEEARQNQTPQTQSARAEGKLPPIGNFSVPVSATKEVNKKQGIKRTVQASAAEGSNRGATQGTAKVRAGDDESGGRASSVFVSCSIPSSLSNIFYPACLMEQKLLY